MVQPLQPYICIRVAYGAGVSEFLRRLYTRPCEEETTLDTSPWQIEACVSFKQKTCLNTESFEILTHDDWVCRVRTTQWNIQKCLSKLYSVAHCCCKNGKGDTQECAHGSVPLLLF